MGEEISVADICLAAQVENAKRYGVRIEEYERIHSISSELERVPEIEAAHPLRQEDAPQKREN